MVYLYNRSQCSDGYGMIFESPFSFMWALLLSDDFLFCFVSCSFGCFVACGACVAEFRIIQFLWVLMFMSALGGLGYSAGCAACGVCVWWALLGNFFIGVLRHSKFEVKSKQCLTCDYILNAAV